MWHYTGNQRPPFAEQPAPGQESVWDYPRPPAVVACEREVSVLHAGNLIARTKRALRVLETASPPTLYIPGEDIDWSQLVATARQSWCEWKGAASYWALADTPQGAPVAWRYLQPRAGFGMLVDHASFYPGRVDCFIGTEAVRPQHSEFYGGWVTDEIVGPFKGDPGTEGW